LPLPGRPRAGGGLIDRDFAFHVNSAACGIQFTWSDHGPRRVNTLATVSPRKVASF
jgi:hypothetical protein